MHTRNEIIVFVPLHHCADAWAEVLNLLTRLSLPIDYQSIANSCFKLKRYIQECEEKKKVCGLVGSNGGSVVNGVVERLTRNGQPFMFLLTLFFVVSLSVNASRHS